MRFQVGHDEHETVHVNGSYLVLFDAGPGVAHWDFKQLMGFEFNVATLFLRSWLGSFASLSAQNEINPSRTLALAGIPRHTLKP